jgi:hypothetical protein
MIVSRTAAVCFTLASLVACASTPSGGGSSTNWVVCETSADCEGGDECVENRCQATVGGGATHSLSVLIMTGAQNQGQELTIGWEGEQPVLSKFGLRLFTTFTSSNEAHAFARTFVVSVAGTELGRDVARFAECDTVQDLGLDPLAARTVLVTRGLFDGALSSDTHSDDIAPTSCFFSLQSLEPVPPPLPGPKRVLFQIPSNERLTFEHAGKGVLPRDVQLFPDTKLWELVIPVDETGGNPGELTVLRDGQLVGSVPVSLDQCTALARQVVEQELRLFPIAGGQPVVAVDDNAGVRCLSVDGTITGAIP